MGIMILCPKCQKALAKRITDLKEAAKKSQAVQVAVECDSCHRLLKTEDELFCKSCYSKKGYNSLALR